MKNILLYFFIAFLVGMEMAAHGQCVASSAPSGVSGTLSICNGSTTSLTVSGGTLGTDAQWKWYTGSCGGTLIDSGAVITVSPTTTKAYWVRAEGGSCSSTTACATATVTVNAVPATPTTSPTGNTGCEGTPAALRGYSVGNTILWYKQASGGSAVDSTASHAYYTPLFDTTHTYYLSAKSGAGCESSQRASIALTVTPAPAAPTMPTSNSPRCQHVTLYYAETPPTNITWYFGSVFNMGSHTHNHDSSYVVDASGTYFIRSRDAVNGCWGLDTVTIDVIVYTKPNAPDSIYSNSPQCQGTGVTLTVAGTPPSGCLWYWQPRTQRFYTTNPESTYTVGSTSTPCIKALDSVGCWSDDKCLSITVNARPAVPTAATPSTATNVCSGANLSISATSTGNSIDWYTQSSGGSLLGSAASGAGFTVNPTTGGAFYAASRSAAGCVSSSRKATGVISILSLPAAPTAPASQSVCSDTAYTFLFDSVLSGSGGNQIEWSRYSGFDSATLVSSGSDISFTVEAGETDTLWLRSRANATGCVSGGVFTTGRVNELPAIPVFTWGDTLIFADSINNICYYAQDIDSTQMRYSIWTGTAGIDSITGCVISHSTSFTVRATATDIAGCKNNSDLNVTVTNVAEPTAPTQQIFKTDTPYTFVFSNIAAGNNGNQIEWAFDKQFTNSTILIAPATISVTLNPGSDTIIWLRSRDSSTHNTSRALATAAKTLYGPISSGLLDKTNWILMWNDEFEYENFDINAPPSLFNDRWNHDYNSQSDCDRMVGCSDETSLKSEDEISIDGNFLHLTGHAIDTPYNVTCTGGSCVSQMHTVKYLTGEISSNVGIDSTGDPSDGIYDGNDGCWDVFDQFYLGMYEIRCKQPAGAGAWSAFWLWNRSEIDIMETRSGTTDDWQTGSTHVHDWDADYNCIVQDNILNGGDLHCDRGFYKSTPYDYSEDFHTYTCVWSNSKITFFTDGKETWSETELLTHPQALKIILGFSTFDVANQDTSYDFVVDYVRVYKSVSNPTYQCLQNIQSSSAKTLDATETALLVHNTWSTQSLSTNIALSRMRTQDVGGNIKVYYRGTDGRCYNSYQTGGNWYEYPLMWTVTDVGDDVTPFNDRVYYRAVVNGVENGLKYFKWNATLEKWENYTTSVSNCGGFLNVDQYGRVSYKGHYDSNLYAWDPVSNTTSQITTDGSVEGGLIMDKCGCLAFYREKNTNNLRQWYWWDDVWHDVGDVASNGKVTNHTTYDAENGIVYFIGSDKKVYAYTVSYSTATTGGLISLYNMIGDDNAASDLIISPDNNLLYYIGDEGKIWYYHNDLEGGSKLTGRWYRSSLNYFAYSDNHAISALCIDGNTGRLFFRGGYSDGGSYERILYTTDWRDADNVCACAEPEDVIHAVYKTDESENVVESNTVNSISNTETNNKAYDIQVSPNPSESNFVFLITGNAGYTELVIEDVNGRRVYEQKINSADGNSLEITWDASSMNAGGYFYRLKTRNKTVTGKLVKI